MTFSVARFLMLASIAATLHGCIGFGIRPSADELSAIRSIAVIAVEPPPLEVLAKKDLSHVTVGQQLITVAPYLGPMPGGLLLIGGGIVAFSELVTGMSAERAERLPARAARLEDVTLLPEAWIPTRVIAEEAAIALNATGRFHATVVPRYYRLPIQNRVPTKFLENWMAPIRDWYNLKTSVVSYAEHLDEVRADVVLEVGLGGPYSLVEEERLHDRGIVLMRVMTKLVEPLTGHVVGRAHAYDNSGTKEQRPFVALLADDGEGFKEVVRWLGRQLVTEDLTKLGLLTK